MKINKFLLFALLLSGAGIAYYGLRVKKLFDNLDYKINIQKSKIDLTKSIATGLKTLFITVSIDLINKENTSISFTDLNFKFFFNKIQFASLHKSQAFIIGAAKTTTIEIPVIINANSLPGAVKTAFRDALDIVTKKNIMIQVQGSISNNLLTLPISTSFNLL